MITDVHVHHVPAGFLRFVQDAAPCSIHLDDACGERVRLRVGALSYDLNRTFFDIERFIPWPQKHSPKLQTNEPPPSAQPATQP